MDTGLSAMLEFPVTDRDTAAALLSGDLPVLGTPRLIAWLEAATCAAISEAQEADQTSVGTRIEVSHVAASPVGAVVVASAMLTAVEGRRLTFAVHAVDAASGDRVGEGTIQRALVGRQRFLDGLSR
jgi:fluoroacetyl-CoA thioesterase